jgi:hypothetical protein
LAAATQEVPSPATAEEPDAVGVIVAHGEKAATEASDTVGKCQTRNFQTSADSVVDGKSSRANILLCAKLGETDEQWIKTLQTTAVLVSESSMSLAAKIKLTGELDAEITRMRAEIKKAKAQKPK